MSSGPTKSSNLMVRKSRHVILKENKSAERLKLEDIPCPESIGLNKNEISLSEHQKQSLKYILDAKKININEDIFLPAAYKWEAPQNKVLTPSHSSTYLSAVSAPAKEPQISVRKSSTSFLLKTIDFVVNVICFHFIIRKHDSIFFSSSFSIQSPIVSCTPHRTSSSGTFWWWCATFLQKFSSSSS